MSTQPIEHKGYGYTFRQPRKPQSDVDFPLGPETSKKRPEQTAAPTGSVRDRIRELLSSVPRSNDDRFSFHAISVHKESMEKDWNARVSSDLKGLGVDTERPFRLTHDPTDGTVRSGNDHPDSMTIDRYFASEVEVADEFASILQLGKLVDAANDKLTPDQMNTSLGSEAMGWWFQSNMNNAALFSGGGIVFGAGDFNYKGIDVRV